MKQRDLAALALIGISAGLLVGCHQKAESAESQKTAIEGLTADMKQFFTTLSPESQKKFLELDAQHKMMAVEMAHQSCHAKNHCSSMGGCQAGNHSCAGQNTCKGEGGAPISNPDKAVEIQHSNQIRQRETLDQQLKTQSDEK